MHLGRIFDCCLSFAKDFLCKKVKFVDCFNNIVTEFGFAHSRYKARIVTYGTSFYGSSVWNLFGADCQNRFITWNITCT